MFEYFCMFAYMWIISKKLFKINTISPWVYKATTFLNKILTREILSSVILKENSFL